MLKEFERAFLTEDLSGTSFVKGDIGTIVFIHENGAGYEIEFFAADGSTLGVETVSAFQVKSVAGIKRVLHINDKAA